MPLASRSEDLHVEVRLTGCSKCKPGIKPPSQADMPTLLITASVHPFANVYLDDEHVLDVSAVLFMQLHEAYVWRFLDAVMHCECGSGEAQITRELRTDVRVVLETQS